jgi:hypothetical protein
MSADKPPNDGTPTTPNSWWGKLPPFWEKEDSLSKRWLTVAQAAAITLTLVSTAVGAFVAFVAPQLSVFHVVVALATINVILYCWLVYRRLRITLKPPKWQEFPLWTFLYVTMFCNAVYCFSRADKEARFVVYGVFGILIGILGFVLALICARDKWKMEMQLLENANAHTEFTIKLLSKITDVLELNQKIEQAESELRSEKKKKSDK